MSGLATTVGIILIRDTYQTRMKIVPSQDDNNDVDSLISNNN